MLAIGHVRGCVGHRQGPLHGSPARSPGSGCKSCEHSTVYSRPHTSRLRHAWAAVSPTKLYEQLRQAEPDPLPETVEAVLFDMDGVLVNSEEVSRKAAATVMSKLYGLNVHPDEFIPFMGTGEANFLGGVARKYNVQSFDPAIAKDAFFRVYLQQYAVPGTLGYPGCVALVQACKAAGLKTAVASSADMIKVTANLQAAELDASLFDAIVTADAFERLKPAPDVFLEAARRLGVAPSRCVVIEDAAAGVQAAAAAGMRCIGVTTTLGADAMVNEQTSLVRSSIADISLADIQQVTWRSASISAADDSTATRQQDDSTSARKQDADKTDAGVTLPSLQEVLSADVQLPGGYRTNRRELLKFGTLGAGFAALYVAFTRAQAMSYVSWQGLLNALFPSAAPPAVEGGASRADRVAAFVRYIEALERRGGGQQVPPFPQGVQWFNSPPLALDRELRGKVVVLDFWTYCCIKPYTKPSTRALHAYVA